MSELKDAPGGATQVTDPIPENHAIPKNPTMASITEDRLEEIRDFYGLTMAMYRITMDRVNSNILHFPNKNEIFSKMEEILNLYETLGDVIVSRGFARETIIYNINDVMEEWFEEILDIYFVKDDDGNFVNVEVQEEDLNDTLERIIDGINDQIRGFPHEHVPYRLSA